MSSSFIILFVVLTCFTEWSLETVVNTTESHINSTESQSTLLQATLQSSDCLRLFAPLLGRYYWVDFCDSNSYIDPYFMYYTNVICSHRSFLTTRYWIVYSRHEFQGQYIIIPPGECNNYLIQYGMTHSSIRTTTDSRSIWRYAVDEFSWPTKLREVNSQCTGRRGKIRT
ncbi:unnamed protein product [Schistosoma haematobium]|nr:unnamed protein product [Schistosoma haematobium]